MTEIFINRCDIDIRTNPEFHIVEVGLLRYY